MIIREGRESMYIDNKIWIGLSDEKKVCILPKMANRHGLIAGATGTGKTVTLKVLAESFSDAGVPVFLADVKGDLSGMIKPGENSENMQGRIERFGLADTNFAFKSYPATFWDVYGQNGIPLRTTISEMGPVLLSKLMDLNDTQTDVLTCLFKMADDEDLLLIDLKDLKAMLSYASENAAEISKEYGNITKQSVAAIIRHVVALEAAGGEQYFSEPGINIVDFFKTNPDGRGVINILDARKLVTDSTLYSAFLLYLLSELFEVLPEVGDLERPRMVFFFDEAHLLFDDISKALRSKLERIIKLIRSKGIGVYFITQSPRDIPDEVLAQLGNKIQHALHAYTPSEEKAMKTVADSFRANPDFDTKEVLSQLGVGEALISVLDEEGIPTVVEKCKVLPPQSLIGMASGEEVSQSYKADNLYLTYKDAKDPDSAYEYLERLRSQQELAMQEEQRHAEELKELEAQQKKNATEERKAQLAQEKAQKAKNNEIKRVAKSVARSAAGTVGREVGGSIGKSIGGSFGKKVGGNMMSTLGRSIMGNLFK